MSKMSENSGKKSVVSRREARRKRILENSQERLSSITGRPASKGFQMEEESDNCLLHDFQNAHRDDVLQEVKEKSAKDAGGELSPSNPTGDDSAKKEDAFDSLAESSSFETTWVKSLLQRRLHLILLSVFVQFLYLFELGYIFYNNLFYPFITVKIMEFLLVNEPFEVDIQQQLILISAIFKGSVARHVLKTFFTVSVIASDFCLYIFIFVVSDKLFKVTFSKLFDD